MPWVSAGILVILLVLAIIGPYITPADPLKNDLGRQLEPPVLFGGSWDRPLGTDYYGRDILSRVIAGARVTAFVSFISVFIAGVVGTLLGMIAGYTKRSGIDMLISRAADLTLSFPIILLGLLLAVQLGPSFTNVIIVLSLLLWSRFAKLARAEVISWRSRDFIALSEVSGGRGAWILRKHMLPNITNTLVVLATLQLGWAVLAEASLSFLGAGVPAPEPAWGSMVSDGRELIARRVVGVDDPGHRHRPRRDGAQPVRRLGARPARPAAEVAVTEVVVAAPGRTCEAPLLSVRDLRMHISAAAGVVRAVDGVSFDVVSGRTLGIVGESGSGKSMTCRSILRLLPPGAQIVGGDVSYRGTSLIGKSDDEMRSYRGRHIALIPQDPLTALNPVITIEKQVAAPLKAHGLAKQRRRDRVVELLGMVGLPKPRDQLRRYPHELSGGMRQRVVSAVALAAEPSLLLADEPTTSLDPTIQLQFLDLLSRLSADLGLGCVFVTHDLGIVNRICDDVAVMYAGRIVEFGPAASVLRDPEHPYTKGLVESVPSLHGNVDRLATIAGRPPRLDQEITGCAFAPRCPAVFDRCHVEYPPTFGTRRHHSRCWLREEAGECR